MQLIILGMHRSGTSSVTRLLNLAGAWFGEPGDATGANEENPRGFWERRDVREVCDGLLHDAGFDWWRLDGFAVGRLPKDSVERRREAMAAVVDRLAPHAPWVIKEPRLCLLLPALLPVLDDPVCVHVTREPLEVAHSIEARNGLPVTAGLALWEMYTVRALEASSGLRRLHVRHEDVMADPVGTTWSQSQVRYYIFALLFVMFDVEAVFIFPWATRLETYGVFGLIEMFIFIFVLLLGLVYAWRKGIVRPEP